MKNIIKLTTGLLLAALFFTGCDIETENIKSPSASSEKNLVGIQITKLPAQVEYFIDEPFDLDGIQVMAIYSNNAKEEVFIGVKNVSGFDSSEAGTKTLTVTWNGKSATFDITVDNIYLSEVKITSLPAKIGYSMYEELELDGLEVTATFNDKSTRELSIHELVITGFDKNNLGKQIITVSFGGTGIGAGLSDTFEVTVTAKTFTIIFDKNGGDGEANPTVKTVIQPTENIDALPSQPTKAGYHFTGWNKKADGSGSDFIATTLVTDSFTVYAQWFKPTVTFYSNIGSEVESREIDYDSAAAEPPVPVKTGYNRKFDGWYTDEEFNNETKWDFTDKVIANVALYAKWIPYELGDVGPGGGKIFYRSEAGFTIKGATAAANETGYYLEASPSDLTTSKGVLPDWGSNGSIGTGTAIGDGKQNTQLIVTTNNTEVAAKVCKNYTNNGFNDWFLPSKEELNQLFSNRNAAGVTLEHSSSGRYYWSSSANSSDQLAWAYYTNAQSNITDAGRNRANTAYVRAIRAF